MNYERFEHFKDFSWSFLLMVLGATLLKAYLYRLDNPLGVIMFFVLMIITVLFFGYAAISFNKFVTFGGFENE